MPGVDAARTLYTRTQYRTAHAGIVLFIGIKYAQYHIRASQRWSIRYGVCAQGQGPIYCTATLSHSLCSTKYIVHALNTVMLRQSPPPTTSRKNQPSSSIWGHWLLDKRAPPSLPTYVSRHRARGPEIPHSPRSSLNTCTMRLCMHACPCLWWYVRAICTSGLCSAEYRLP